MNFLMGKEGAADLQWAFSEAGYGEVMLPAQLAWKTTVTGHQLLKPELTGPELTGPVKQ